MSIILISKLMVGGVFTAIASTLVVLNWDKIIGLPYRDIVVYAKTDSGDTVSEEIETKYDINKNNYQCRWAKTAGQENENKLFECSIKQLQEDASSKKHFEHNSFEVAKKDKIKTAGTIVQISFKSNKYEWQYEGKDNIEIVSTSTSAQDEGKKYGTAGIWFIQDKGKAINTKYFIAKSKISANQSANSYICSWSDNAPTSEAKKCNVYDFVLIPPTPASKEKTDYSSSTFAKPDKESKIISQHNYYLVKWEDNQSEDLYNKKMTIFVTSNATQSDEEKIELEKIKPSFLIGDDQLLIINK